MTLGTLQLMKRTAWLNMQRERRTATEEEAAALTGYAAVYLANKLVEELENSQPNL